MKFKKIIKPIWFLIILFLMLAGCRKGEPEITIIQKKLPSSIIQAMPIKEGILINKYPGNFTCFKIETAEGVTIITDPFGMDEYVQADIVTESHNHMDHTDKSHISGNYYLINTVGTFTKKGIKITGVAGHHNKGDMTTTNIIYIFDLNGLRLAQFASQGVLPTEAMFKQIGKVDVLIIQIFGSGRSKLSVEEVHKIVQCVQAKIVIPAHGDTRQSDIFASLLKNGASKIIDNGKLLVTKATLDAQLKPMVIVLDVD